MPFFTTDDEVRIHYALFHADAPTQGPPLFLQHGFTGNHEVDFVDNGLIGKLTTAGRQVVALDARGHGLSDKPTQAQFYGEERMAKDVSQLADQLGLKQYDLLGFSMGAVVALFAAANDQRIRRFVLTGLGASAVEQGGLDRTVLDVDAMAETLEGVAAGGEVDGVTADYLRYLDERGLDRAAVAAIARARHGTPDLPFERMSAPCLLLIGDADPLATRPEVLAAALPNARLSVLPGDHLSVLSHPDFAAQLLDFLAAP